MLATIIIYLSSVLPCLQVLYDTNVCIKKKKNFYGFCKDTKSITV